jgi:hypothetical protein
MTEQPGMDVCAQFEDDLAELALGILTGRGRAATLAHVETCVRCADELDLLARAADAVVATASATEPPVGFEVRLFNRMGLDAATPRRRAVATRWTLAAAAAVIALGLGLGLGLGGGSGNPSPTEAAGHPFASADLVEHGSTVGHVFLYGGQKPWMFMNLADSGARGTVTCVVITADGRRHVVGTFAAASGYGAWGAPLHVAPSAVRRAEVLSASGTVIATAPLA